MKLGVIKRINKETLARFGELPKWIDALMEPLNEFLEKAGLALQGRLTFEDNFLVKPVTQKFMHAVESEINPVLTGQANLRVKGVVPMASSGVTIDMFSWTHKPGGNIGITFHFSGATDAVCYVIIFLG